MMEQNEMTAICAKMQAILEDFKAQLLGEVKQLIAKSSGALPNKWIKSTEVKDILNISHGKLQTMRNSGQIPFTRIGGSLFYDRNDILQMFEDLKINRKKVTDFPPRRIGNYAA